MLFVWFWRQFCLILYSVKGVVCLFVFLFTAVWWKHIWNLIFKKMPQIERNKEPCHTLKTQSWEVNTSFLFGKNLGTGPGTLCRQTSNRILCHSREQKSQRSWRGKLGCWNLRIRITIPDFSGVFNFCLFTWINQSCFIFWSLLYFWLFSSFSGFPSFSPVFQSTSCHVRWTALMEGRRSALMLPCSQAVSG